MKNIDTLKAEIQADIDKIKVKRKALTQLQAEEKRHIPFSHTFLGKVYLGAIKGATSPFASLNSHVTDQLDNPFYLQCRTLKEQATKLLRKCGTKNREDGDARKFCLKAAHLVVKLEVFSERHKDWAPGTLELVTSKLRDQVERLRPPKDEKRLDEIKNIMEEALEQAFTGQST